MRLQKLVMGLFLAVIAMILTRPEDGYALLLPPINNQRHFYNIAHMCNSEFDIKWYLMNGANAVEIDIQFSKSGFPTYAYHGFPCDCFRNCFKYISFKAVLELLHGLTTPDTAIYREQLAVIMLDLKIQNLPKRMLEIAGQHLAEIIIQRLFKVTMLGGNGRDSRAWLILSVPSTESVLFFKGFRQVFLHWKLDALLDRIGYDIYSNGEIGDIEGALGLVGITHNVWIGDGVTNCIPRLIFWRLHTLVDGRMHSKLNYKAYQWTLDGSMEIRRAVRAGVDGIITNRPDRIYEILKEREFKNHIRLATNKDRPF